jgi:NADH:ubiquinone oxidoreductase subunit 4 (subunit M)
VWSFVLGLLLSSSTALAEGRLAVVAAGDQRGALLLTPRDGALHGDAKLRNTGDAPLVVYRIAVHGDADDIRAPRGVRIKHEPLPLSVAPGEERSFGVEWGPEAGGPSQAHFHVIITSSDEQAGELAIGVRGDTRPWYRGYTLSLFALVCLLGAGAVAALRRPVVTRTVPLATAGATLLLSLVVASEFSPALVAAQGNDGLQLMERLPLIPSLGAEYFLAADASSPVLLLAAALLFCLQSAALPSDRPLSAAGRIMAFAGFFLCIVTRDLALLCGGLFAALSFALLATAVARPQSLHAVLRLAGLWTVAAGLALLAIGALHHGSGPSFSLDGARTVHTFVLPELSRMSFQAGHTQLLGLPLPRFAFVCGVASVLMLGCVPPLHLSFLGVAQQADAPELSTLAAVRLLGLLMLVRVWCTLLPETALWAEGALCGVGAASGLFAALGAHGAVEHRRRWAQLVLLDLGLALAAVGTQSPAGSVAALLTLAAAPLVASAVLSVAPGRFAVEGADAHTWPVGRQAGAPLVVLAVVAFVGLPGTLQLARDYEVVRSLLPAHMGLLVLAGLGAALGRLGALRSLPALLSHGSAPASHGGRLALALCLALVVLFGVYPRPVIEPLALFADSVSRLPR